MKPTEEMSGAQVKKTIDKAALMKRLLSSLILWSIVSAVFLSREITAVVALVTILAVLGSYEYVRITKLEPGKHRRVGGFIISLVYLAWLSCDLLGIFTENQVEHTEQRLVGFTPEMMGLLGTLFLAFLMSLRSKIVGVDSLYAVGLSLLGYCYVPLLFGGFMLRLTFLPPDPILSGAWLVLFTAVVTKFTDMGAYLSGSLFGRHKMAQHISPSKTWEGAIGSFLVAQLGAFLIWRLAGESLAWMGEWWSISLLAVIISVAAIVGDLAESILKRSVKVKDSGVMLPGIGGVLDLIDSLCFSAPAAYLYLLFFSDLS